MPGGSGPFREAIRRGRRLLWSITWTTWSPPQALPGQAPSSWAQNARAYQDSAASLQAEYSILQASPLAPLQDETAALLASSRVLFEAPLSLAELASLRASAKQNGEEAFTFT